MLDKFSLLIVLLISLFLLPVKYSQAEDVTFYANQQVESGWAALKSGDFGTALINFNQAIIIAPQYAPGYYGKGHTFLAMNKIGLAITNLKKTIELADPPMVEAFVNLGLALTISGREQEGLKMYNRALDLDPMNKEAHLNLADLYCSELNGRKAWEHIRQAQKMKADIPTDQLDEMNSLCPEN